MPTTLLKPSMDIGSVLGKFVLRELLGEGGMGQVYRAEDTLLHRNVAIKVLRPEFSQSDDFHQRFLREARLAASIEHDCIVPIYDLGQDNGVWYLAMQLLQGETLHAYLKREQVPSLAATMSIFAQVLRGLAVAHRKGLIHRDIKPSNLWLEPLVGEGKYRCRILDFGLACNDSAEGYKTSTGSGGFGTVFYMPFEQLNQEKVDHRADLYSLGVVLYEMLTGRLPYRSPSPVAQAFEMWEGPPKPPHEVNSNVPRPISELNLKMLLHARETRIGSAIEVLEELETIITNPDGKPLIAGTLPDFVAFPRRSSVEISLKSPSQGSLPDPGSNPIVPSEKPEANHPAAETDLDVWTMHPQAPTIGFVSSVPDEEFDKELQRVLTDEMENGPEPTPETERSVTPVAVATEVVAPNRTPKSRRKLMVLVVAVVLGGLVVGLRGSSKAPAGSTPSPESHAATEEHHGEEHVSNIAKHEPTKHTIQNPIRSNLPAPAPLDCTGPQGASASQVEIARKAWAEYLGVPAVSTVDLGNGVSMKVALIPPGKYWMGSSKSDVANALKADPALELKRLDKEEPQHTVVLTTPFYLGAFEVTREEFASLVGTVKPSRSGDHPHLPMNRVSWKEAKEFCEKLSHLPLPHGFSRATLPTEAQWEYACRAGTRSHFHFGEPLNGQEANCNGTTPFGVKTKGPFREQVLEVGQFPANRFGLHDLHGNLAEWCLDEWQEFSYRAEGRTDPVISGGSRDRIIRGGSWDDYPRFCRSACRNWTDADSRTDYIGFRVALVP